MIRANPQQKKKACSFLKKRTKKLLFIECTRSNKRF